jgi:hypothetical protein
VNTEPRFDVHRQAAAESVFMIVGDLSRITPTVSGQTGRDFGRTACKVGT